MHAYVALLRAINVGGTGQLAMADLRQLCEECGFHAVATYIHRATSCFGASSPKPSSSVLSNKP
jgi:uncharacterized protein (DUF1697 family)